MNLLLELIDILELKGETAGLKLAPFKLDVGRKVILTKIGNKTYEFTPKEKNVAELFNSVTGVAKHSPGRALVYLKQHATGVPVKESIIAEAQVDTIIEHMNTALADLLKSGGYSTEAKDHFKDFHDILRRYLMKDDMEGFGEAWDRLLGQYPDVFGEYAEALFEAAGMKPDKGTFDEFLELAAAD